MTTTIPVLAMFSPQDMLIIFLIVLLLFGAKKLPELAKGMGQAVREFTKAKDEVERELTRPPEPPAPPAAPTQTQEHKPADVAASAPTDPQHHA